MSLTESQFIRERCLQVIRKASMHEKQWEWTILDRVHEALAAQIGLRDDEYPIVSFYAGADDWTLMTTHRMVGSVAGQRTEIGRDDFSTADFGDFKQDLDSPRLTRARIVVRGRSQPFLYESGYASMAPIYYFRFWSVKWPAWRETYRLSRRHNIAEPDATPNSRPPSQLPTSPEVQSPDSQRTPSSGGCG